MAQRKHQIVPVAAARDTRYGYTKVTDDIKHGKVITEKYLPIAKQVTMDYQNGKVITKELLCKKITTKDYRKGTVTTMDRKMAETVTEDNRKGLMTVEKHVTSKTTTKDVRTTGHVIITKQPHHSSKEAHPMKTNKHLEKKKAHRGN